MAPWNAAPFYLRNKEHQVLWPCLHPVLGSTFVNPVTNGQR